MKNPFSAKGQPPTLAEVVADAIQHKDLACLVRLGPDIRAKMSPKHLEELRYQVGECFGYEAAERLLGPVGGEAA